MKKNCQFVNVTAEQYRQELVEDAFINGLTSNMIRQRLLESKDLTLIQACETSRTLEHAQYNSEHYTRADTQVNASGENVPQSEDYTASLQITRVNAVTVKKQCWFYGSNFHSRFKCPAQNSECNICYKTGHWTCWFRRNQRVTAVVNNNELYAVLAAAPHYLALPLSLSK